MQQISATIRSTSGLHARPAAQLVKIAKQFKSNITIMYNEKSVNAKSLISLLSLAVPGNSNIQLTVEGEDEEEAIKAFENLLNENPGAS